MFTAIIIGFLVYLIIMMLVGDRKVGKKLKKLTEEQKELGKSLEEGNIVSLDATRKAIATFKENAAPAIEQVKTAASEAKTSFVDTRQKAATQELLRKLQANPDLISAMLAATAAEQLEEASEA
jgi:hypothetical protein